jgi:lauroyl/myristoyl acyltransferase
LLRELARTWIYGWLRVGMEIARTAEDPAVVEGLRCLLLGLSKTVVPVRRRLATNMRLAGVHRAGLEDEHFGRAIDQMIMLAHVFRAGFRNSGCPEKFRFDGSFALLEQAYAAGRGVINIAPHLCGYPVYPPIVTPRIPCSIYLRRNKDPRKMRINEAIGLAGKGHLVSPPPGASRAERLQVAIDVVRQGRMIFITPDTPRKSDQGVAVTIFGRQVHFPPGVFVMSLRTGAPVVPTFWHWQDGAYHIRCGQPIELARRGRLKEQAESAMRKWARSVDEFLHQHPEMWWNWLDKRWTRILRQRTGP